MVSVKAIAFAGVGLIATTAAHAADMPQLMPPPPMPHYERFRQRVVPARRHRHEQPEARQPVQRAVRLGRPVENIHKDFDSAPIFGLGLGYQFNNWLRADVTGEYRGKSNFHGYDIVYAGGNTYTDEYRGSKSEWLVLANIYADLGTWDAFTPFVGAGIGGSWNTISNFMDICTTCPGGGVAHGVSASKANFAWARSRRRCLQGHAQLTLEFAYRYVDLGDALSGDLTTYLGQNNVNNPMHFRNITSHDFKFGVRWLLDSGPKYEPRYEHRYEPKYEPQYPPLMRRG